MSSIFSKIVAGDIPSFKIAEDDRFLAFLDVFPLAKGHTLVIPKKEIDNIFDLDSKTYSDLWSFAQKVSKAMNSAIDCERIGVAVIGLEVPHAHIHLIPINSVSDIDFSRPKLSFEKEEMEEVARKIASFL